MNNKGAVFHIAPQGLITDTSYGEKFQGNIFDFFWMSLTFFPRDYTFAMASEKDQVLSNLLSYLRVVLFPLTSCTQKNVMDTVHRNSCFLTLAPGEAERLEER